MINIDKIKNIIKEELGKELKDDGVVVNCIGKSTGIKGDIGLYGYMVIISVNSMDWEKLKKTQSRITNEISLVSRILYEIN